MHPRWKYCGALQSVDKVSYPRICWLLVPISYCLSDACMILVFLLTLTWRCAPRSLRHVQCFAALQQLRSICRSVSNDMMQLLIMALVFSRLDNGSATLADLPKQLMDRFQSVQNAAAWLIFEVCRQDHVQPPLRRLHWLRMPEHISFWLAVLAHHCPHSSAPGYLTSDPQHVSYLNTRQQLRSSTTSELVTPHTVHSTIGNCTFPASAASVWNSLQESVRSSPLLQVFWSRWKTKLLLSLTATLTNSDSLQWLLRDFTVFYCYVSWESIRLHATLKSIHTSSSSSSSTVSEYWLLWHQVSDCAQPTLEIHSHSHL